MTSLRRFGFGLAALVLVLDQISKYWILNVVRLEDTGPWDILPPLFEFVMVWNRGVSYGFFQQSTELGRWILIIGSILAAIWMGWWLWRETRRLSVVGLALLIGGAIGNAIDRAIYGAVADFIHFTPWGIFPYVFNVADAGIVVGVMVLLYESFRPSRPPADQNG